jgi:protein-tyrosine phosphatase
MRILLVCLGNICRSPTAEAALREALAGAGFDGIVEVDSAGTGDWHVGEPPDRRMAAAAAEAGLRLEGVARRIQPADFHRFDLVLAMDRANLRKLHALAPDEDSRAKIRLFREFEPGADGDEVPDPYYGGADGFARVVEIVRAGARGLVDHLRETVGEQQG